MSPYNGLLLHFMSMGRTCSQFTPRKYTAIAPYVFIVPLPSHTYMSQSQLLIRPTETTAQSGTQDKGLRSMRLRLYPIAYSSQSDNMPIRSLFVILRS
ncbi:uncharacterized protein EKO05_0009641 [Ascochyta rabiei]|uniref:uncharacterized protein n=1 Tax=Didymella rabiei TaxID=5454 RepID=UPI0021FC781F|nr:uncharacterized protein EKO05_0009641 [Ascochyta rabiei]UPX19375.1 hypothetical protein EKO05_0009641 [Ascochyta rabiei]